MYFKRKLHKVDGPAIDYMNLYKWYVNDILHREDGPAVEKLNKQKWYKNGKLHREDGPAYVFDDGERKIEKWYKDGKLHRDNDEPAVITSNCQEWYINGLRHRDNGFPAICKKFNDGTEKYEWLVNGERHREDGPAILNNNREEFYLENELYSKNKFIELIKEKNKNSKNAILDCTNICKDVSGIIADYLWSLTL